MSFEFQSELLTRADYYLKVDSIFLLRVDCSLRDVGASEFRSRKKLLTKQEKEPTARFVNSESSRGES